MVPQIKSPVKKIWTAQAPTPIPAINWRLSQKQVYSQLQKFGIIHAK